MSVSPLAMRAYLNSMEHAKMGGLTQKKTQSAEIAQPGKKSGGFADEMLGSLEKLNTMQADKDKMVQQFASGQNDNVHELMIALNKAGLAMNMTTAVRGKVLEAYKELSRLQF